MAGEPKSRETRAAELTGAQALLRSLERLGVDTVFGLPGGAILPLYDPLFDSGIRHVLVRHEQAAGHAAEGYAVATGRVGVCIATSGPGATNLVTPIGDAYMDSVPLIAITGQVNSTSIGTDAFQEADIRGITTPITKHNFLVTRAEDIPAALVEAYHIAHTGRPGPVLVDVAKDALNDVVPFVWPEKVVLPGYKPTVTPHARQMSSAAQVLARAERPVLVAGGGIIRAGAAKELAAFVETTRIPVVTTLTAKGALPSTHPFNMGMPGMHGTVAAVGAIQRADVVLAIGTRFDDRVTGELSTFAPHATVIHADIDPAEIGKNVNADVPIVGDARKVLAGLIARLGDKGLQDLTPWHEYLQRLKDRYRVGRERSADGTLSPQRVIERIGEKFGTEAIYVTGVGQHQMWAAHLLPVGRPNHFLTSGGAGTMGYCVPAAMGAQVGRPDAVVVGVDGDGCFQMTNQELVTCALNHIPVKIAVINNNTLGMVRQWQSLFYNERYSNTDLHSDQLPNVPMLAEAMGAAGLRARTEDEVDEILARAVEINDRPVVMEFICEKDAMVWPMVAAGTSNDDIKIARDMAPNWEEDEL
ncbi:acetolactate synthase large subunit [uncultured Propionibacterium sp.]|uniref:acetolactate synthase large subunit n=1 Tax=uncultured Propionibacterium sp. TaxID=218066 RepID=UPI00292EA2A0|nr:acetolactate synthase large subunit [uncultured Propionibacterium sp.]